MVVTLTDNAALKSISAATLIPALFICTLGASGHQGTASMAATLRNAALGKFRRLSSSSQLGGHSPFDKLL